jgi:hypothetical protein
MHRELSANVSSYRKYGIIISVCVCVTVFFLIWIEPTKSFIYISNKTKKDGRVDSAYINAFGRLQSKLSPELEWCVSNPFLAAYNQIEVLALEIKWFEWSKNSLPRAYEMLRDYAVSKRSKTGEIVRVAYPTALPLPCSHKQGLKRYGGIHDGSKIMCGLEIMERNTSCIIYSLGSFNNFNFEFDVLKQTSCEIHTYDCTSEPPQKTANLYFHKICMGETSHLQPYTFPFVGQPMNPYLNNTSLFKPFHTIVQENNHTHVHILKMDIEGGEYSVFADLLKNSAETNLPYQISFESHWWDRDIYHSTLHQHMFAQLWRSGYRFLQHEFNPSDNTCVEWTLMRVFC